MVCGCLVCAKWHLKGYLFSLVVTRHWAFFLRKLREHLKHLRHLHLIVHRESGSGTASERSLKMSMFEANRHSLQRLRCLPRGTELDTSKDIKENPQVPRSQRQTKRTTAESLVFVQLMTG